MKKHISPLVVFLSLTLSLSLVGCNSDINVSDNSNYSNGNSSLVTEISSDTETSEYAESSRKSEHNEPIDIAALPVKHVDWGNIFDDPIKGAFSITDKLGENYYGIKSMFNSSLRSEEILLNEKSRAERTLKFPNNFPEWRYGSGSFVTLDNRYFYNWLSYTSQFTPESLHDMKLTRVDGNTGEVTIIDETKALSPLIYLVKINEKSFLSYSVTLDPSDFATLTTASIYYSDGTKKEIISEKYQNEEGWTDSIGTLIENFAVKDGEIYGFGRRLISGEYKFFLYHYNNAGGLLETTELFGMSDVIGNMQAAEFYLVGDYIIFRTYEDLKRHICRITANGVVLLAEGIHYAISGSRIFFIESNVDSSGNIKDKEIPLYSIDIETDVITAVNFDVPEENPRFYRFSALSNGDLMFQYCPNGEYDPLNFINYVLPIKKVNALIDVNK